MSPEGKPIQVDANALQAAGVQNGIGMKDSVHKRDDIKTNIKPRIVNKLHNGITSSYLNNRALEYNVNKK